MKNLEKTTLYLEQGMLTGEVEVLNKNELKNIVESLDFKELGHKAFNLARMNEGRTGQVFGKIDATDGEVSVYFEEMAIILRRSLDTNVELFAINVDDTEMYGAEELRDIIVTVCEQKVLDYYDDIFEKYDEQESWYFDTGEVLDKTLEYFNLNKKDVMEEYYEIIDENALDYLINESAIDERIEEFYSNEVEK